MTNTITPFLTVRHGNQAIQFYQSGLGATILKRYDSPDGKLSAKLAIEGAEFYIGDEETEFGNNSPETFGGSPVRIILVVQDPEAVYNRAIEAGAIQICPVTTEESWKIGKLKDPFGHIWEIGHPLHGE
jgi:PhnB protein